MQSLLRSRWLAGAGLAVLLMAGSASAQPGGGRGGFGGGPGMGGMMDIGLLFSPQVREEIELVPEQEEQLREIGDSMREDMMSMFRDMRDMSEEERRAASEKMREKVDSKLKEVLLDHQYERFNQLRLQSQMQRGAADALGSGRIRDELGITDEQLEEMRKVAETAEAELRTKIQKATQEAREKVLEVLTAEQRAKWKTLVGESFEFQQGGWGRGGGFGGPGGPGGGGPGGGRGGRGGRDRGGDRGGNDNQN